MTSEGDNPYETVVRAARPREEVARQTLQREELRSVPGTFGDPLRAILNLPGIARAPFALGLLLVRGTGPDDSAVFVDGHEVPNLYHFLGGPSVLNGDLLERIDYYPGGFGPRYGRALGGILDVETHPGDRTSWHGDAEVDLIDANLFVEGPVLGGSVAAAVRRSYVDAVLPLVLPDPDDGATLAIVPVYYDGQLRIDRPFGPNHNVSLLAFGSDDRLEVASSDPQEGEDLNLDAHIAFWRVQGEWRAKLGRTLTSSFSPMIGRDIATLDVGTGTAADVAFLSMRLREELTYKPFRGLQLRFGADLEQLQETISANLPQIPEWRTLNAPCSTGGGGEGDGNRAVNDQNDLSGRERLERREDLTHLALYAEAVWDVGGGLRLVPGLRVERYAYGDVQPVVVDPRLTIRYQFDAHTAFKSAIGIYTQPAPPQFIDAELGNPRLDPEHAEQYSVGIERKLTDVIELDAQLFYSARHDLVTLSNDFSVGETLDRTLFANQGEGRSYGLELLVRHPPTKHFFGWISYTLSRSDTQVAQGENARPTFFDQTHNLIVVGSLRLDGGWELGGRFRVTTGRPVTPVDGATFDSDSGRYCALRGEPGSDRGPVFTQLDLRAEKTWTFDLWRFSVYLDVQNVYNAENPEAQQWDYRFRERQLIPGIPILPTLGVRGVL
jgi:outer membrane receptor protein involved in Fe transport